MYMQYIILCYYFILLFYIIYIYIYVIYIYIYIYICKSKLFSTRKLNFMYKNR